MDWIKRLHHTTPCQASSVIAVQCKSERTDKKYLKRDFPAVILRQSCATDMQRHYTNEAVANITVIYVTMMPFPGDGSILISCLLSNTYINIYHCEILPGKEMAMLQTSGICMVYCLRDFD